MDPKTATPTCLFSKMVLRVFSLLTVIATLVVPCALQAQSGGSMSGTVTDSSGALVPKATVVALNVATGVETQRSTSSDGLYSISPLIAGTYTLTVSANGFSTFKQENLTVDALSNLGFNVTLKTGSASETITVTDLPPMIDTTSPTLGGVIENSMYTELPVMITGLQQRDITQFSNLLPGAQVNPGGRSSIIGGTGQRLGELYLDGLPLTTVSQQGDNRPVFNIVPLESIDQIKVVTSGFSAEYQGAGLENYSLKSGTDKYHGSLFTFVRNTAFDAWSFSNKPGGANKVSVINPSTGLTTQVDGPKPAEHQIEFGYAVGGLIKVPHLFNGDGHRKMFFYTTYDKFRSRQAVNYSSTTVPTTLMKQGNFQELLDPSIPANANTGALGNRSNVNYAIYDPTSQAACTAHSTNGPCRYQYGYSWNGTNGPAGNPVLTPGKANIIPASQLSPITQYLQKFLPTPTNDTTGMIQANYLGGVPQGYDNWLYSGRIDYTISDRQSLSMVVTGGNRHAVPYTIGTALPLPVPYYASTISIVGGHWADLQHTYLITNNLINQFKYGFMNFGGPPVQNNSQGIPEYGFAASGVTGLPSGQASQDFPFITFSGSNAPANWSGNSPTTTNVSETYTALDNLQWIKGKHSMNFGGQYQWLENNASANGFDGNSGQISMTFGINPTANLASATTYAPNTGYSYASFLVGGVSSTSATQQLIGLVGSRFHPFALYFQDDFKATPKLTFNLGLRWDYLPTYTEAKDRWSFLNPDITNPITGNPGALQFAGSAVGGGVSCNCRTPVNNYYKNFGPRVGFAYAVDEKTVFRGGFGILYSHAGGTGGAAGAGIGTGQVGYSSATPTFAETTSGPAFYLNNNPTFTGGPNAVFGGSTYVMPAPTPISATSQATNTGYYVCAGQTYSPCYGATGTYSGNGASIAYADPYLSSRAPQLEFFNFGMQREVTKDITVTLNYVGSESHFISGAAGIRGLYAGQLDPKYLSLGSALTSRATTANVAAAGLTAAVPYAGYTAAAAVSANATIAHMLTWKPQYAGTTDTWGINVANGTYNAFQLSVAKRMTHGLAFNVNYTYSKNIDDAGTQRSGYDIPGSVIANGKSYVKNRIDRSLSINSQPQNLSAFGVYKLPFGKGHIGGEHFITRALFGGWDMSHIFQYSSGIPLAVVATCASSTGNIGQGTCMPDVNPSYTGDPRQNGGWGKDITAATLGTKQYLKGTLSGVPGGGAGSTTAKPIPCASSAGPFCDSANYTIGDAPRIAPYGLRGPSVYRLTSAVHRTFDITERTKFVFGVDCQNVTNHVTFGNNASNQSIIVNADTSNFGAVALASADARAFQFSGRLTF